MATEVIIPNSDISHNFWSPYSYTYIDEHPSSPDGLTCNIPKGSSFADVIHGYGDMVAGTVYEITSIVFSSYAKKAYNGTLRLTPKINGSYLSSQTLSLTINYAWYHKTWNGSWTKADINTLQCRYRGNTPDLSSVKLDTVYVTLTYTINPPPIPSPPTNVNTNESPCTDGQSTITWTKSGGATKYRIFECTTSTGTYYAIGSELGDVASGPTDVETISQTLYYRVKAGSGGGWSGFSQVYATVVFDLSYNKVINGVSSYSKINDVNDTDIEAWNDVIN